MTTNEPSISRQHIPTLRADTQARLEALEQALARLGERVTGLEERLNRTTDRARDS